MDILLDEFQREVGDWHHHNFPNASAVEIALKLASEVGELADACGRLHSGIGNTGKNLRNEEDAIGDIMVVLAAYCEKQHIDMEETTAKVWAVVKQRDWVADPVNGGKDKEATE